RGELAADQIRVPRCGRIRLGGAHPFAAPRPVDAGGAHEPGHLIAADVVTGPTCRLPQLAHPVDAVVVLPQRHQGRPQDGVTAGRRRRGAGIGVVVGAGGHRHPCSAQDGADGLDPELLALGVDELDYFLCWRSSSAPKKLAARFSISLARLSSRFSCSRALIRCDSAVDTPGAYPSSMSAWRTQERTDSTP